MKQFRSTILIFIFFLGLVGYYFWTEKKKTVNEEEKKISIFKFNKDDIKTLELIDMSDNTRFQLQKEKEWKILNPVEMPASEKTIDGIISELAKLSADRDITKDQQDFRNYDLSVPKYKIKFTVGSAAYMLFIGDKNPTNEFYFVKEEDKDNIYTVNIAVIDKMIKRNLFDLRDKEFLRIPEEQIKKLEITIKNKGKFIIEKNSENKWQVSDSGKKDLDQEIQNLFHELNGLSIEEFLEAEPSKAKDYGLDQPLYILTINKNNGERVNLNFGIMENNLVYTARNKDGMIMKARRNLIDSIENLYINMKE